jgi:hypothetical protein
VDPGNTRYASGPGLRPESCQLTACHDGFVHGWRANGKGQAIYKDLAELRSGRLSTDQALKYNHRHARN